MVSIAAFKAANPGSIPGRRSFVLQVLKTECYVEFESHSVSEVGWYSGEHSCLQSRYPGFEEEEIRVKMQPVRITQQQIHNKIKKLRRNAAPGPDGIKPALLQDLGESILAPLEIIFNKAMETGQSPEDWKTAYVTPIHKKGTKGNPGNYRPVSLTSVPCKIMESIVKDRVMSHLLENSLI